MEGGKRDETFFSALYCANTFTNCILNNLKIVGPLSKMKPCTRRGPKKGKKTLETCDVQTFDNQVNAVVGAHLKE